MKTDVLSSFIEKILETLKFIKDSDEWNLKDDSRLEQDLLIIDLLKEEISSNRKSIYIAGKTNSGKSSLLNYILNSDGAKIIPQTCRTETRMILKILHSNIKRVIFKLKNKPENKLPQSLKKIIKESKFAILDENENNLEIDIKSQEGIDLFHLVIKRSDLYDPKRHLDLATLYYPLNFFKDYIIYDTPGLESGRPETDEEVIVKMFGRSLIIWMLHINEPNLTETKTILENNIDIFKKIEKERLLFISNYYDQLHKKCLDNKIEKEPFEFIKENFYQFAIDKNIQLSNLYFSVLNNIDFEPYRVLTDSTLLSIEKYLIDKGKKIQILNITNASQKIQNLFEAFNTFLNDKIAVIEMGIKKLMESIKKYKEIIENKKSDLPDLDDIINFNEVEKEIKNFCDNIIASKTNDYYNTRIKDLSDYINGLPALLKKKINKTASNGYLNKEEADILKSVFNNDTEELAEEILNLKVGWFKRNIKDMIYFWGRVNKKLKEPFKDGLNCKYLKSFNEYFEKTEKLVVKEFNIMKDKWNEQIENEYEDKIGIEKEKVSKEREEINKITVFLNELETRIMEISDNSKYINEYFDEIVENWEEPKNTDKTDEKLLKFLELFRNIKMIENTKNNYIKYQYGQIK